MAVDAVYLFDEKQQIRRAIVWGVYELIHDEATNELDAEIDAKYAAKPGEFLGFFGIDHRFLLFEIDKAENDDTRGVLVITATYAPVKELARQIVREIRLTGTDVQTAGEAALDGSGWTLARAEAGGRKADLNKYYETRWKTLKEISIQWQARVVAGYEFDGVKITGKTVDITQRENVYRGRLFEGASGTSQIYVTRSGSPVTRLYGLGKATGTEDPPTCVTFKDVVWSKANGDPADKPAGQDYIEDADAIALYGEGREDVFQDKNIEDQGELISATWAELQRLIRPKVSGTATSSDMEHIPGHEHQIARMYDLVWVRTKHGEDVTAVIINVKRNYLREGLTKIYVGEETDDSGLIKKIAQLSSKTDANGKSSSAQANRYIETKRLIQLNADTIQMNARLIEANAEEIQLTASNLKKYEEGTDERLTLAELTLWGDGTSANAGLVARMKQSENGLTQQNEALLQLRADAESANATLAARVSNNEASIQLHADELGSKVSISALEIELQGYVTATELSAEIARIDRFFAGNSTAAKMVVTNLNALSMTFDGLSCKWQYVDVVTEVTPSLDYMDPFNVVINAETGATRAVRIANGVNVSLTKSPFTFLVSTT